MLNCQRCEAALDVNWHYCPNCGEPAISTDITAGKENAVAESAIQQPQGQYGSGVREQVLEVIIRQAMKGAPWRELCFEPMRVNQITEGEVLAELQRRQANDDGQLPRVTKKPMSPDR